MRVPAPFCYPAQSFRLLEQEEPVTAPPAPIHTTISRVSSLGMIMMDLKLLFCAALFPVQIVFCVLKAAVRLLVPQTRKDLGSDVVLVTGGGRGIGSYLAKEFAKQGAKKVPDF